MDFGFRVNVAGVRVGGYHRDRDDDRGHHGHHYGGNIRFNGGGHHSRGSVTISSGGGGYYGGGYDPTFAGNRYEERQIFGERDRWGSYDPTWAGHRYEERKFKEALAREEQQYEYDHLPAGAVPSYGRGYVGPRYDSARSSSFAVRQEQELIEQDRTNTPPANELPQETTGRDASSKQGGAPAVDNTAPAAEANTPAPAAVPAGTPAEQRELNQKAQVYLESLHFETGQLDENGKRTPGAGQKKLSAATDQTSFDALAKEFDGVVGTKTKDALRKAGIDPDAPITQATLDALAEKISVERAKAEVQAQLPLDVTATAETLAKPLAVAASPTAAVVVGAMTIAENNPDVAALASSATTAVTTALTQPNVQPDAAIAAAAPAVPPAQPSDIGVSAGGPPPQLSALFGAMQGFGSAPETSAPVQQGPVQPALSQKPLFDIPVLNIADANPQDVSAPGAALVFNGQGPRSQERNV